MSNRYFLMLEESREGFESLDDLFKSDLLLEAKAVFESQSLATPTLIGNGFVNITDKAALEWAGDKDLDDWGYIPPMFLAALANLADEWKNFHEFGGLNPNGDRADTTEQDELDMLHTI